MAAQVLVADSPLRRRSWNFLADMLSRTGTSYSPLDITSGVLFVDVIEIAYSAILSRLTTDHTMEPAETADTGS